MDPMQQMGGMGGMPPPTAGQGGAGDPRQLIMALLAQNPQLMAKLQGGGGMGQPPGMPPGALPMMAGVSAQAPGMQPY
jgi:hypothetical protein